MTSSDPVAVVTGGGGGLGSTIARALSADGYRTVLVDLDLAAAQSAAAAVTAASGRECFAMEADITSQQSVASVTAELWSRCGRVDALVNNAGVEPAMNLETATESAWDLTMSVNLRGAMLMTQAVLPFFREQSGGSVVNISSRAHIGGSTNPAYSSSKAGLVGFTLATAVELGPWGVRSNAVSPSFVRTAFNEQRRDITDMEGMVQKYEAFTPLRRLIEPEDVANSVVFLASDRARGITGQVIHVTAGSHLPPMV